MKFRCLALSALILFAGLSSVAQSDSTSAQNQEPSTHPSLQQHPDGQGQTPAQAPSLTIRQTVRRVIVDVMVRDQYGKPVHGLTAGDFSITDDKQAQHVLSFDAYNFEKPSISRGPNAPPLPPNMFVNLPKDPERGPLYLILLDLVNTEMEDQMRARQQILKFINSKPAGTRFAVFVTTDRLRLIQGFTDDKDLLYAALDPYRPKPHVPKVFLMGKNYGYGDPYTAVDMLTHVGQYLDGIPGRKNLMWVSGTFPLSLYPEDSDSAYWDSDVKAELNALAQAQVAVFTVDLRGVVTNPEGALTGGTPHGGAANQSNGVASNSLGSAASNPTLQGMRVAGRGNSLNRNYATEEEIASITGGRAFYGTNDVAEALTDATEDGGNYYTLTYAPPTGSDDGKCHNIGVKLAQAGYQLSYRRNYCHTPLVSEPRQESEDASQSSVPLIFPLQAGDVLQGNMRPGAPMLHDLIFSARVRSTGSATLASPAQMAEITAQADYYRTHRKNRPDKPVRPVKIQEYSIDYRVYDPQFRAQQARSVNGDRLEFAVAAFDIDGKVLNGTVNDAAPEASTEVTENKSGIYRVHQSLVVPITAVSIRVGVRDRFSDRMGTIEVPLPLQPEPVASAAH